MPRLFLTFILAAALALTVVACGGNDTTSPADNAPEATNLLAQRCPLEVVMSESGVEEYAEAKPDAWDTSEILDLPLGEAQAIAEENGCEVQVSVQDGQGLPVSLGLFPNRVLVWTEENIVVQIEQVG